MDNKKDDNRPTIFLDLDGTLVKHNYTPETTEEVFLEDNIKNILALGKASYVLTTARSKEHLKKAIAGLIRRGIRFDHIVCDLPTGPRLLVNDSKDGTKKAFSINLERDKNAKRGVFESIFEE